jgi:hypothetical protein
LGQMPAGFNRRRMIAIFPISALISKEIPFCLEYKTLRSPT